MVVDTYNKPREDAREFGHVILACKPSFASQVTKSHVEFSWRQANKIACALANVTIFLASSITFIDVPTCITQLLINEMI